MARAPSGSTCFKLCSCTPTFSVINKIQPLLVPASLEFRFQENLKDLQGNARSHDSPTHGQNVCIIVEPAHLGRVDVMTQGGSDSPESIRGDGHPDSRAANQHPPVVFAPTDRPGHRS